MKKLRSAICILIMVVITMSMVPTTAFAASDTAVDAANELYNMGLFQGTGTNADGTPNFNLDRAPTRNEAVTMLVRLLGKEDEAKAGSWDIPFIDVVDWAKPYVGYAYANGLTTGTSSTAYSGGKTVTAAQYITFVLRSLGYKDGVDFQWNKSWELSDKIGLTNHEYNETTTDFTRGDVALISYKSLSIEHYVAVDRIELNESFLSMEIGESATLTATISPADATEQNITWSSSNTDVANVSNGQVTALSSGSAVITAKCGNKEATCTVTVTAKPISFSGTGDKVISNINIPAGTYYAEYTHSGRRNFISKFYYGSESYEYFRISNEIGDCSGQVALKDNDNAAITNGTLDVKADGTWTISFIPVSGTTTTNIKGHGEIVTGLFTANSPRYVVSMTHSGERNFIAKAIKYNGKSYDYERLANEIGTYSGQRVINLDVGEQYFIYVKADGNWTFDFGLGDAVTTYAPPAIPSSTGSGSESNTGSTTPSTSGETGSGSGSNTGSTTPSPSEPITGGIDALLSYIGSHGRIKDGTQYIQETMTTNGMTIVSTIYYIDDETLLFHCECNYSGNVYYIRLYYDIPSQSASSRVDIAGVGGLITNICLADIDISSYTENTTLTFEKGNEGPLTRYPENYNEEANILTRIAVSSWGLLILDKANVLLNDIGFTSYLTD